MKTGYITVEIPAAISPYRPRWMRRIGEALHPEWVTAAWYASDCAPVDGGVRWRIACWLRGAK